MKHDENRALLSPKTLDFLFENRLHDSRQWFEEHKEQYQRYVITPLKQLVEALTPAMLQIDGDFVTQPRVDKTISRIWRDTRYSKDKSFYRASMWIIFKRGKMHGTELPGYYFEITGQGFNHGCGFYAASTGYMETMRLQILNGAPSFLAARRAFERQNVYTLDGERYKRPHFPDQPQALRDWLELRGISLNADSSDFDLLFSNRLAGYLAEQFQKIAPVYRFMLEVSQEYRRKEAQQAALNR